MEKRSILEVSSIVILCTLAIAIFGSAFALLQSYKTVPNSGSIKGVGVGIYWNSACTNQTSSIDWGTLGPGTQKSFTMYIRNEGNLAITLSQSTANWNPSGSSNYLTLTWNYNGQTINAGANIQVTLTLSVSASITGVSSFNFDIIIVGSG